MISEYSNTYLKSINEIPLLSLKEEAELSKRIQNGDKAALDLLITSNLRLVVKIAHEFKEYGLPLDDLISEGNIGAIYFRGKLSRRKSC